MNPPPYEVQIDPAKLLLVGLEDNEGQIHTFVALVCRFLVKRGTDGLPRVAVEIVFDPDDQQPLTVYYCDRARLQRRFAAPSRVKQIRPYRSA